MKHLLRASVLSGLAMLSVLFSCSLGGVSSAFADPQPHVGYSVRVPILMYHYIRYDLNPRDRVGEDLSVMPANFAQQMQYLAANDFQTITLDDLTDAILYGKSLPVHPIILTFDDGYADLYSNAYPVLKEYGFKATSFIITGKVGKSGYLTWEEMREMQASRLVQFESHTVDHVDMSRVSLARAQFELEDSKAALEKQLGVPVKYFCYPSGRYNVGVEALVARDGYMAGLGTKPGVMHSLADFGALTRVRIRGSDPLKAFEQKLSLPQSPHRVTPRVIQQAGDKGRYRISGPFIF